MGSGTSKTKRPRLRIRKPLSDQDWRDWANEVHAGHMRATDMQNHRGQWITLRANTQAGVLEYFEGGEWRGLGYGGGGGGTALSGARAGARAGGGADLPNHNLLPGLQGGAPWRGEYYHFQRAAHDELGRLWDGGQWDLSGEYMAEGHVNTLHVRQRIGIGAGAEASPAYALHVQKPVADGDQRTFAYFKNPSAEHTAYAGISLEADTPTATANLAMFAALYDLVTDGVDTWGGKAAVYSGIGANAMVVAAQYNAPIEFWVEEHTESPPDDTWYHVANITKDGVFPNSDGTYAFGNESGPLRWASGSFDQLWTAQLGAYSDADLISLAPSSVTVGGDTHLNGTTYHTAQVAADTPAYVAWFNRKNYGTGLIYIGFQASSIYYSFLAAATDASLQFSTYDGSWHNPLKIQATGILTPRIYLNSTAYIDGATAGALMVPSGVTLQWAYARASGTGNLIRFTYAAGGYPNNDLSIDTEASLAFSKPVKHSGGLGVEYQTQSGAWANPSALPGITNWSGRAVLVYNSTTSPYRRLYAYMNGAWGYANLTPI